MCSALSPVMCAAGREASADLDRIFGGDVHGDWRFRLEGGIRYAFHRPP